MYLCFRTEYTVLVALVGGGGGGKGSGCGFKFAGSRTRSRIFSGSAALKTIRVTTVNFRELSRKVHDN